MTTFVLSQVLIFRCSTCFRLTSRVVGRKPTSLSCLERLPREQVVCSCSLVQIKPPQPILLTALRKPGAPSSFRRHESGRNWSFFKGMRKRARFVGRNRRFPSQTQRKRSALTLAQLDSRHVRNRIFSWYQTLAEVFINGRSCIVFCHR
jgi:hypothetical protein